MPIRAVAPYRLSFSVAAVRSVAFALTALLALPFGAAQADDEMTFQATTLRDRGCVHDCPAIIAAVGRITDRTPEAFLNFISRRRDRNLHAVVFLDSPGGGVLASMQFGALMRRVGAAAVVARVGIDDRGEPAIVNAQCFSACVYALIGARKRVIPRESQVGIHRMFLSADGLDPETEALLKRQHYDTRDMRSVLSVYASRMGVSPDLISRAEHTPSESLYILSQADIRRWRLGVPTL